MPFSHVLHDRQTPEPETVRARRPPLPGARWPSWRLARPIALVQGNARQGPPTLRHQCQRVQDPPSLELNRRLVIRSGLSEVFSAVNGSVEPSHLFVISSNLTSINARTIGSVLTLHRYFHLSPLDPLARRREGRAEGAACSVAQSKRDGNRDAASVRSEKVLGLLRIHWPLFSRYSPLFSPTVRPPNYRQRLFVEHDLGEPSASAVAAAAGGYSAPHQAGVNMLRFLVPTEVWRA